MSLLFLLFFCTEVTYTFTSVIFFDFIKEGSKRDSKSAAARGEKNGEHSQILSCDIVEKLPVKNKKTSQPGFLILQVKKNEIYYEGQVFWSLVTALQTQDNLSCFHVGIELSFI